MDTVQEYIVGSGPPPEWCRHRMMAYQKKDGSIGFEFFGYIRTYTLSRGDKLILRNGKIKIRREAARHESKDIPRSN